MDRTKLPLSVPYLVCDKINHKFTGAIYIFQVSSLEIKRRSQKEEGVRPFSSKPKSILSEKNYFFYYYLFIHYTDFIQNQTYMYNIKY